MSVLREKSVESEEKEIDVTEEKKEEFDKLFKDKNLVKVDETKKDKPITQEPILKSETEQSFKVSKDNAKKNKHIVYILGAIIALIIILLSAMLCFNMFYNRTFANVYISGINVSNLTKEDAVAKVESELATVLEKEILLKCDNKEYTFLPSSVGVEYDVEKAVNEVYNIGRGGNILDNNLEMIKLFFSKKDEKLDFKYDETKFEELVSSINSEFSSLVQSSYEIVDNKLIIKKGMSGTEIKADVLKEKIIESIKAVNFEPIEVGVIVRAPDAIDIDEIHNEIYKAPVNAYYTKDPFQVHESQNGVDFAISLDDAKALLENDQAEYEIALKVLYPSVTTAQIGSEAFPDLLATCTTTYITSKVGRTTNLKIASSKVNGYVLMPGSTFSYNRVVGERTAAAGFQVAGVYSGGKEVEGLGGGICQISSTLYNIVIKSGLEIVERENHSFLPGYLPAGQDATVVYGAIDFKFKNTRQYPVKIVSSVSDGYVTMKMYGVKEDNEPEISFETVYHQTLYPKTVYEDTTSLPAGQTKLQSSGKNGCKSTTYKVVKQNGTVISKTVLSNDTYQAMNNYMLRGVQKAEPVQETVPESESTTEAPAAPAESETQTE